MRYESKFLKIQIYIQFYFGEKYRLNFQKSRSFLLEICISFLVMDPYFKGEKKKKPKDEKCYIYKKTDGTEKELDLDVHRSFLLFRYFNHNIPENNSPLLPTHLSDEEMRVVYKCVLLSYLSYKDRNIIEFPPEIKLEYEKFDSTVGRIPFFIITDTSINAIIVSCRGSSCMDDFITDSMGNGLQYDGGKFHEGVFNTASYVFHSCQNKVIELNQTFNNESVEAHQSSDDSQNQAENLSINNDDDDDEENSQNKKSTKNVSKVKRSSSKKSNIDNDNDNDEQGVKHDLQSRKSTRRFRKVKSMLDQIETPTDLFNKKKKERTKIIFTGHSLGAAVAGVVTYLFKKHLPQLDAHCICFAPPPTMTFNIWQTTGSYIKSFMIEGDLVPFLSVQNLLHISDIMFPGQTSNQAFKKFVHKYLKKKSVEEVQAIAVLTDTFYPPGQMYLLRFTDNDSEDESNDKSKKKKKKNKKKKKSDVEEDNIQLCQILNPDYFSSFVKNIQESNHAIKNYMRMIIRLMKKNIIYQPVDSEQS